MVEPQRELAQRGPSGPDRSDQWLADALPPSQRAPLAERLEQVALGGPRRYTRRDIEQRSGVSRERTQRLWRALGFADAADDDMYFTEADLKALELIDRLVEAGFIDATIESAAARAAGQSLSRLAEWQIGLLHDHLVTRMGGGPTEAENETVVRFAETILPVMDQLHSYVWRRHLAALTGRALSVPNEEDTSDQIVVGFADVVGYTRMSRQLTETELARLVEQFESMAIEVIASNGGRIVKTMGDEVLFVADEPDGAATIGLGLLDGMATDPELPKLRIGMAHGHVLSRFGDVYGPVVNIASRLTSAAKAGTVLVDRELAAALEGDTRFRLRRRRPMTVRGYSNLSSWRLGRAPAPAA